MKRNYGAVILAIAGVVVVETTLIGNFTNYVKPAHGPLLLAVGIGMVLIGATGYLHDRRRQTEYSEMAQRRAATLHTAGPQRVDREVIDEARNLDRQHDHYRTPPAALLLCLPLFLILLVPPPPIGAWSAQRSAPTVPKPARSYAALPAGNGPVSLEEFDYAERAVWDNGRTLTGRTVSLTGFVTPKQDGSWYLARERITCCAADARTYLVDPLGTTKQFPANTWVQVTGTFTRGSAGADTGTAHIQVASVDVVSRPANPYEQ